MSSPEDVRYSMPLDEYEIANLRQGLLFLREVGGDTGDWLGQILNKLPESTVAPNHSVRDQKRALALRVGWKGLFS